MEYLIDSIASKDNTLQATIGLIRTNTNNMRNNFEAAASGMIEVDPYRRSTRIRPAMLIFLLSILMQAEDLLLLISASILKISFSPYLKISKMNCVSG